MPIIIRKLITKNDEKDIDQDLDAWSKFRKEDITDDLKRFL